MELQAKCYGLEIIHQRNFCGLEQGWINPRKIPRNLNRKDKKLHEAGKEGSEGGTEIYI